MSRRAWRALIGIIVTAPIGIFCAVMIALGGSPLLGALLAALLVGECLFFCQDIVRRERRARRSA